MAPLAIVIAYLASQPNRISGFAPDGVPFTVARQPWPVDRLGNIRAVVEASDGARIVSAHIPWRRRDHDVGDKAVIVAPLNDPAKVVPSLVLRSDWASGDLLFRPIPGVTRYAVYYLPFAFDTTEGGTDTHYIKPFREDSSGWAIGGPIPPAHVLRFEARTEFDSFAPMELPATEAEVGYVAANSPKSYWVFPEDRLRPVRMFDRIPALWAQRGPSDSFEGYARPNEYYVFQLGVCPRTIDLKDVRVHFSELVSKQRQRIPASCFTCFNLGGTNWDGSPLRKRVDIRKGAVLPLWIGVDMPEKPSPGAYDGMVTITPSNAEPTRVKVRIVVWGRPLADRGDGDLWRYARLRWLNSTLGASDEPVPPYGPVTLKGTRLSVLGRRLTVGRNGLPSEIEAGVKPVLARPIEFRIGTETAKGGSLKLSQPGAGRVAWVSSQELPSWSWRLSGDLEFDGHAGLALELKAKRDQTVDDFALEIPYARESSGYFMGIGHRGGFTPSDHVWRWTGPYDSWWLGDVHSGLRVQLRGSSYEGPLQNLYHPAPPATWSNGGRGYVEVHKLDGQATVTVHCGRETVRKGQTLRFEFAMLITPVKPIDTAWQFRTRFYHNAVDYTPTQPAIEAGANVINVHHANDINPYINYPFRRAQAMKRFVDGQHRAGRKVKIYDTIRELSNYTAELWPLLALDGEVFEKGDGGGFAWLQEHVQTGYIPSWYHPYPKSGTADASMVTAGFSRWINYYVEGLRWLAKNVDIDGLYLDDVSYDRRVLKRMRRVLAAGGRLPMIDLHSNTGFSIGPANQYTDFFPYVDRLWFGESFDYNHMPADQWLVETSGIPFGLMGEMLQGGGNRWLGMVFGMTTRFGWTNYMAANNPDPVWRFWDRFGIAGSKMIGYWEPDCPVKTDVPGVYVTVYRRKDRTLVAVGNFGDKPVKCRLRVDWRALGLDPAKVKLSAPAIEYYQPRQEFQVDGEIPVDAKQGWLIVLR